MARGYTDRSFRDPSRAFTQYNTVDDREIFFYDEFLGDNLDTNKWELDENNINTGAAMLDGEENASGSFGVALDSDSNAEQMLLSMGDMRAFNLKKSLFFECRIRIPVIPTDVVEAVWGMAGDEVADPAVYDNITEAAWFKVDGSIAVDCESDDTTNDENGVASGITMAIGDYNVFQIDFKDLANVKFYIDGSPVATGQTFDMSNLTDAEAMMQPMIGMMKATGAGLGSISIDYVKIWQSR